jgi:hypothetical protein
MSASWRPNRKPDAVRLAIAGGQLRFVDAGSRNRRARQRNQELLVVGEQPNPTRPLADGEGADDLARLGIDDRDAATRLVRHIDART